jgi:hypothetical protein
VNRKIGKFKLWQLLVLGGGIGFILYEYEKKKEGSGESALEAGPAVSTAGPGSGGGGEGGGVSAPVAPGIPGEPGPAGPAGAPGAPAPAELAAPSGTEKATPATTNVGNEPLKGKVAAAASKFPLVNPVTGEHYKIVKEHGQTIHVYHSGKRVVVGGAKPSRKAKNNAHQAKKHARVKAHPANPLHTNSHAAPVAAHQHGRPVPVKHRVKAKRR